MDSAPPQLAPEGSLSTVDELPPEALALASRFFDAARTGQIDMFEQALSKGLPSNLTNDKGDTLVSTAPVDELGISQSSALLGEDTTRKVQ